MFLFRQLYRNSFDHYYKFGERTMYSRWVLYFVFLFGLSVNARAEKQSAQVVVFACSDDKMGKLPDANIAMFEDRSNSLTFEQVFKLFPQSFLPFADVKKKMHRHTNYWACVTLKNARGIHTLWMLQLGLSRFSDVYIPNQNGVYTKQQYGYNWPDAQKTNSEILWDVAAVPMEANETKTIFIRFHSDLNIGIKPLINIVTYQELKESTLVINLLQGIFHGLALMMLLYSLFMFFSLRDRAFLYYVFYVSTISLSMFILVGYMRHYVMTETGCNPLNSELVIQYMGVIYLLFFRKFSDLKNISVRADKYVKILTYISVILASSATILWFNNFYAFNLFSQLSSLFELAALLSVIIISLMYGNKIIRYFLLGSLSFTVGASCILLGILLFKIPFAHLLPVFQIGVVLELFLFSIGLSQRYKYNEELRKQAQDQLISELQMREAYQQQLNEELEQKVRERTAEISQQNEEILVQRDHIEAQKDVIEHANIQLMDSIQYARFIQKTIFQDKGEIYQHFSDAFIWLRPHSVVSGDFYWWYKISDTLFVFSVADCTGHGVPGAMMTVIANGMLEEIVRYQNKTMPNEILEALEDCVASRFRTHESQAQSTNGLDIGIVLIDTQQQMLYFSGAKIPLYYIVNNEIQKIKAELYGIGSHSLAKKKTFELHQMSLQKDVCYYMCSDGIQDQFGGANNKKFTSQRLAEHLLANHQKPMVQQHKLLEAEIDKWKIGFNQTDDILIAGFKV